MFFFCKNSIPKRTKLLTTRYDQVFIFDSSIKDETRAITPQLCMFTEHIFPPKLIWVLINIIQHSECLFWRHQCWVTSLTKVLRMQELNTEVYRGYRFVVLCSMKVLSQTYCWCFFPDWPPFLDCQWHVWHGQNRDPVTMIVYWTRNW